MCTPGLTFVASNVLDPAKTLDEKYNKFYNDEHLPDVLASGLTKLALRYKNINTESKMPYIALYPVEDASMTGSEAAVKLIQDTRKSKTFDGEDIYDYINFDIRRYEKIQTYEAYQQEGRSGNERGRTIICVGMEPGDEADFDEWYRKQHLDMLGMCRGYRRCTRYKNMDDQQPRFLALHEYDCKAEDVPSEQIKQVVATEWSKKIVGEAKIFDRNVFELIQAQGQTEINL
ncbi:hypothetical protein M409DRAFT_27892 [Zasmidium cellare ATCC 36951]|uniref:EthD domain-containing protein n=1 Tax=Zasmidium cellare ATCC 36951 TaxID=1080233 RepID=A0A6A6C8S4_ZASCE|nr:uncharacterized protein M409DRAFT_27892 [Zasmidium cellare ATCC 36951]KAF2161836.1 hypothetical protein M409DRAFT_27892 [Zasmidium cellare ATCC 36951]